MVFSKEWFLKHQRYIRAFANTWLGKKILHIDGDKSSVGKNKIIGILPNAIFWEGKKKNEYVAEFRTNEKFGRRLYFAFKPVWNLIHAWDMLFANNFVPKYNLGFDTLTVYPDANPETNTVDGRIRNSGVTYSTVRNAASGTAAGPSDTNQANWHGITGGTYFVDRSVFLYDTSSLTSSATITAATMSIYVDGGGIANADSDTLNIVSSNPASNTDLTTADFDVFGTTSYGSLAFASFSTAQYNNITVNATGQAAISKTSITKFGSRTSRDISSSAPTGETYIADVFYADYTGSTRDPKLVVTFTLPATGGDQSYSYIL